MNSITSKGCFVLRLWKLLESNYIDLLITIAVFLLPSVIIPARGQRDLLNLAVGLLSAFVLFPICLLSISYIYSSQLDSKYRSLLEQYKRSFQRYFEYLFLIVVPGGVLAIPIFLVLFVFSSVHLLLLSNVLLRSLAYLVAFAIARYVMFFSLPFLLQENKAYWENIRMSLTQFGKNKMQMFGIMAFSLLIACIQLPEALHLTEDATTVAIIEFITRIATIVFSLLSIDYYSRLKSGPNYA